MEDESKLAYKFLLKVSKKQKHKRFNEFLSYSEVISLNSRTNDLTLDLFLIKTIISQQVSTKAARSIWLKTYEYIKNSSTWSEEQLRQSGLSRPKASYIYDILQNKELRSLTTKKILEMQESDIDSYFLNIRGVGPWTLCSLKMFYLCNADVFIYGDLAINKACESFFSDLSAVKEYTPFRTYLCLYLWASFNQT